MKKTAIFYTLLFIAATLLAGCGREKTKDDRIEEKALRLYNAEMKSGDFCKAAQVVAGRFEYPDDYQTSNDVLTERMLKWEVRRREVTLDCKKQKWPAYKAAIENRLNDLRQKKDEYESLQRVAVAMVGGSFDEDQMSRHCFASFAISNKSKFPISAVGFADDPLHNHVGDFMVQQADRADAAAGPNGDFLRAVAAHERMRVQHIPPVDYASGQTDGEWNGARNPISSGDTKIVAMCNFKIAGPDSIYRQMDEPSYSMAVKWVALGSGERVELWRYVRGESGYDFDNQIQSLQRKLITEDPNQSMATDQHGGQS
jgi:hypothetical protein